MTSDYLNVKIVMKTGTLVSLIEPIFDGWVIHPMPAQLQRVEKYTNIAKNFRLKLLFLHPNKIKYKI